jgi:hypothetical protein
MKRWGAFFYGPLPGLWRSRAGSRVSSAFVAALMSATVWLLAPIQAASQTCNTVYGEGGFPSAYECSLAPGNYTSPISLQAPLDPVVAQTLPMTASPLQGTITVAADQGTGIPLAILTDASTYSAGLAQSLTITNYGALTVNSGSAAGFLAGLSAEQHGGPGAPGSGDRGGGPGGNTQAPFSLTNSGAITINDVTVGGGGAGIFALSLGGVGGSADLYNSFQGGSGGSAAGATITNSAAITVTASGTGGYGGIEALGRGGSPGQEGAVGGYGGASSVSTSAPVSVTWTWQGTSSENYGVYGVVASAATRTSSTCGFLAPTGVDRPAT